MKSTLAIIISFISICQLSAQMKTGLTGLPDTSYSIRVELNKHLKNYPFIKIAEGLPVHHISEERNITYCETPEKRLMVDIFYNNLPSKKKRTALIFIHGGGWRSGNNKMHHPLLRELAFKDYVCFSPEYRLSTDALYPAAILDIKSCIRWVRAHAKDYNINPNRIVVAGHSAGGELASFVGTTNHMDEFEGTGCEKKYSSEANAVINVDGTLAFIHPESGEGDDSKKISAATYWFGYTKTENPEIWKQAAPLSHVGKKDPPFLFINSGVARMHAGREDFIQVLKRHDIASDVKEFKGAPHTFIFFHPWFDSTVVYIDKYLRSLFSTDGLRKNDIVVAKDGTGNFSSVQAAINSLHSNKKDSHSIYIKKGIYEEKILIDSALGPITLKGEDKLNTILTFSDHTGKLSPAGDTINTRTSWSFKIKADNFTATDITFRNDAGFSAGQAVAVESVGDKARFFYCRFIGNQDVLFTNNENSRQYFEACYIEGTTDFIFGSSTAWFEKCVIYSKKNSHITAASTPQGNKFGYVFNYSILLGDSSLQNVSLGRPWRPYASVAFLNSYIGAHVKPEGWSNWNNTENYKTTRYAEFKNFGPSSDPGKRVKWSKQLSEDDLKKYKLKEVLRGWDPVLNH